MPSDRISLSSYLHIITSSCHHIIKIMISHHTIISYHIIMSHHIRSSYNVIISSYHNIVISLIHCGGHELMINAYMKSPIVDALSHCSIAQASSCLSVTAPCPLLKITQTVSQASLQCLTMWHPMCLAAAPVSPALEKEVSGNARRRF